MKDYRITICFQAEDNDTAFAKFCKPIADSGIPECFIRLVYLRPDANTETIITFGEKP